MKCFEGREKSHIWGKPKRSTILFKYLKVRSYRGFFLGKLVNLLLVRVTTSFYKPESENFTYWIKCYVEWINAFK